MTESRAGEDAGQDGLSIRLMSHWIERIEALEDGVRMSRMNGALEGTGGGKFCASVLGLPVEVTVRPRSSVAGSTRVMLRGRWKGCVPDVAHTWSLRDSWPSYVDGAVKKRFLEEHGVKYGAAMHAMDNALRDAQGLRRYGTYDDYFTSAYARDFSPLVAEANGDWSVLFGPGVSPAECLETFCRLIEGAGGDPVADFCVDLYRFTENCALLLQLCPSMWRPYPSLLYYCNPDVDYSGSDETIYALVDLARCDLDWMHGILEHV